MRFLMNLTLVLVAGSVFCGCGPSDLKFWDKDRKSSSNPGSVGSSFQITTTALANGNVGSIYNETVGTANGQGPYSWTVVQGSLPTGLTLSQSGALTGTLSGSGNFNFSLQVTDANGLVAQRGFGITVGVSNNITWGALILPDGQVGVSYNFDLKSLVSGGVEPYTFTVSSGVLPDGVNLTTNGVLSGVPQTVGVTFVNFRVESFGNTGAATNGVNITIN